MGGKAMGKVAVVGSTNIDLAMRLKRWPQVGETVVGEDMQTTVGGKGANQAVAAARLGSDVTFLSAIGADSFGAMAEDKFAQERLATTLYRSDRHTGTALIDIGPDGGNIIKLAPGANGSLAPEFLAANQDALEGCAVLLLQNEVPVEVSLAAANVARAAGCLVVMDPAPAPDPIWPDDVFRAFDVITPNATEAAAILGQTVETVQDGVKAAGALAGRFGGSAIVTLGGLGAAWFHDGQGGHRACPEVDAIDTVAAGDCFNGAFATGLAASQSFEASVTLALEASAIATTRRGAIDSLPGKGDVPGFERLWRKA